MKTAISPHVVVMDVNHHVRDFLKRELEREDFAVSTVGREEELSRCLSRHPEPQVVVIDPQLFPPGIAKRLEKVMRRYPRVQIIVHTYSDCFDDYVPGASVHFIEKNAANISLLKRKIQEVAGAA